MTVSSIELWTKDIHFFEDIKQNTNKQTKNCYIWGAGKYLEIWLKRLIIQTAAD